MTRSALEPAAPGGRLDVLAVGMAGVDILIGPADALPPPNGMRMMREMKFSTGGVASTYARDAARLGMSAALATGIGGDLFGELLSAEHAKDGVDLTFSLRSGGLPTAGTVVLIDSAGERSFLHRRGAADRLIDPARIDGRLFRHVHIGGQPLVPEYGGEAGAAFLRRMREEGATTSMDTVFSALDDWAPARALLPELDVALPSYEEAVPLCEGERDPLRQLQYMLARGAAAAAVKLGAEGAVFAARGEAPFQIRPTPVRTVDATGAGEAFCAGFTYGWLAGWELERSARLAVACGALATQELGGPDALRPVADVFAWAETAGFSAQRV